MKVKYKFFRGSFVSWEELFAEASAFASQIGPTLVINISHAVAGTDGTVAVWYWSEEE
jgi:hypothetical protein